MVDEITKDELKEIKGNDQCCIVDIRPQSVYNKGHIPESICIPFQSLPNEIDRLTDKQQIVVICPEGKSSMKAARLISASAAIDDSVTIQSLAGGLEAWDGEITSTNAESPL
ncbi:MAG: rhodanese-like domain-containing protein [Halobacteriaceae archaeon]